MTVRVTETVRAELLEMHKAGMLPGDIATELELSVPIVYKYLRAANVVPNKRKGQSALSKLNPEDYETIVSRYEAGDKVLDLLTEYDLSHVQFYTLLRQLTITPRTVRESELEGRRMAIDHAVALYIRSGLTISEIVDETGVHQPVLSREIRIRGLPQRRPRKVYDAEGASVTPEGGSDAT